MICSNNKMGSVFWTTMYMHATTHHPNGVLP